MFLIQEGAESDWDEEDKLLNDTKKHLFQWLEITSSKSVLKEYYSNNLWQVSCIRTTIKSPHGGFSQDAFHIFFFFQKYSDIELAEVGLCG